MQHVVSNGLYIKVKYHALRNLKITITRFWNTCSIF